MAGYIKCAFLVNLIALISLSNSKAPVPVYIFLFIVNFWVFVFWSDMTAKGRAEAKRIKLARVQIRLEYQNVKFTFIFLRGRPLTAFESKYDAESLRSSLVDSERFGLINIDRYYILVSPPLSESDQHKIQKYYTEFILPPHGKITDKFIIQPESEEAQRFKHKVIIKQVNDRIAQGRTTRPFFRKPTGQEVCVYIIDSPGGVKVGVANDPDRRLKEVQTGSPVDVVLKSHFWFQNRADAMLVEQRVHEKFRDSGHHARGEWFKMDGAEAYDRIRSIVYSMIASEEIDQQLSAIEQREVLRCIRQKKNPYYGNYYRRRAYR
jgi:hypothetical protein